METDETSVAVAGFDSLPIELVLKVLHKVDDPCDLVSFLRSCKKVLATFSMDSERILNSLTETTLPRHLHRIARWIAIAGSTRTANSLYNPSQYPHSSFESFLRHQRVVDDRLPAKYLGSVG